MVTDGLILVNDSRWGHPQVMDGVYYKWLKDDNWRVPNFQKHPCWFMVGQCLPAGGWYNQLVMVVIVMESKVVATTTTVLVYNDLLLQ